MTQPKIGGESREWYNAAGVRQTEMKFGSGERFLVFLNGTSAEHAAAREEGCELPISIWLMHKETPSNPDTPPLPPSTHPNGDPIADSDGSGAVAGAPAAATLASNAAVTPPFSYGEIGGPPHVATDLGMQMKLRVGQAISQAVNAQKDGSSQDFARLKQQKASKSGMMGGLMGLGKKMFGEVKEIVGAGGPEGVVPPEERADAAVRDVVLGHGSLDIGADMRETKPREVKVPLHLPIASAVHTSGLPDQLTTLLTGKITASGGTVSNAADDPSGTSRLSSDEVMQQLPEGLKQMTVPVGTAVVRIATVRWQPGGLASRRAQQVPSDSDIIATKSGGIASAVNAHNPNAEDDALGDGENPYALRLTGSFMQYRWEESESREVQMRLRGLKPVLDKESALGDRLKKRAENLVERLDGRKAEVAYATKRDEELRMLDKMADFIKETYNASESALMPQHRDRKAEETEKAAAEELSKSLKKRGKKEKDMDPKALRMERLHARLRVAYRDAEPTPEDLRSVDLIDEILQWQEYMVRLGRGLQECVKLW